MVAQRSFGRRVNPQPRFAPAQAQAAAPSTKPVVGEVSAEPHSPAAAKTDSESIDQELQEWKRARRSNFKIPWRQLSLMASLCFGIASFVLPDTVNDNVQWLLYALAAASLYAGFSKRLRRVMD